MCILSELSKDRSVIDRLSRPLEEAAFTIAVLRKLKCASISTLDERVTCQKLVYFANELGIIPKYEFNLYLKGPYSPQLARDLYALSNHFEKVPEADFISKNTEDSFKRLDDLLTRTSKNPRTLEVMATLHFFYRETKNKEVAREKTKLRKLASDDELRIAETILNELRLW